MLFHPCSCVLTCFHAVKPTEMSFCYSFDGRLLLWRIDLNAACFQGDKMKTFFWEFGPLIRGNFFTNWFLSLKHQIKS